MNNNNIRKAALALAISATLGASAGAQAAIEVYNEGGTSFSVDGYFNAFYVNRDDKLADTRNSDVKMGFLPNTVGFNFSKEMGELTLGGRSSFWSTINDSCSRQPILPSMCVSCMPPWTDLLVRC